MKVEVDHPRLLVPYGLCGRKPTLNLNGKICQELRSCVKVAVAVLGSPSLTVLMVAACVRAATSNLNGETCQR